MKVKIRKGDTVEVISGRLEDKGKRGEVIKVLPEEGRIVVQGVNLRKKHKKDMSTSGGRSLGSGIIEFEAPVSISNVMLVCPSCHDLARVSIHRDEDSAQRMCKKCQARFD